MTGISIAEATAINKKGMSTSSFAGSTLAERLGALLGLLAANIQRS